MRIPSPVLLPRLLFLALCLMTLCLPAPAKDAKLGSTGDVTLTITGSEDPEALSNTLEVLRRSGKNIILKVGTVGGNAEVKPKDRPPQLDMPKAEDNLFFRAALLFTTGFDEGNRQLPSVARLPSQWAANWAHNRNGADNLSAGALVTLVLAVSLLGAFGVRRLLGPWAQRHGTPANQRITRRAYAGLFYLARDVAGIFVLAAVGHYLSLWLLPAADLARQLADGLGWYAMAVFAYAACGRFLLAPDNSARRLLPMPHAQHQFRMLMIYAVLGAGTITSVGLLAMVADADALTGWTTLIALLMTAYKVFWFWNGRHDIAALVMAGHPASAPTSFAARLTPWLLMASATAIWAMSRAATVMDDGNRWSAAAGITQLIIIFIPILAAGAHALLACLFHLSAQAPDEPPWLRALRRTVVTAAGGFVWLMGALAMVRLWAPLLGDVAIADQPPMALHFIGIGFFAFAGWVFWIYLKAFFDCYTPKHTPIGSHNEEEADHDAIPSRLATVLPVMRGLVLGTVAALTILFVLARLGVDISPLLAGFGILGLAISFGSQSLVRDIVSGAFFMVEDAFRVGEYVDTGRLKGTVEKISLRSMQLRHQSGLIHTIPFGQITSVTNASRDWSTVKFNLRLDHGADIEKARKLIKKTGAAMLENDEFGAHFITPLKMQGVSDISDTAIIVRLKFTAKPAQSSLLQREALKRLFVVLPQNGVYFASNQVTVRGMQERGMVEGAAAMQAAAQGQPAVAG